MNPSIPFSLFASCIPVKGISRSIICDLQRNNYVFIPNSLYDLITDHHHKTIRSIKEFYNNQYNEIIDDYFKFLEEHEFIFFTKTPKLFPKLDLNWQEPAYINNAIIDRNNEDELDYGSIFSELEELGCKHVQIRFFSSLPWDKLNMICQALENRRIVSVDFVMPFCTDFTKESFTSLLQEFPRISSITCFNAPENETFNPSNSESLGSVLFVKNKMSNATHCGQINPSLFSINIKTFTESQGHNTCLNRKISIDVDGNIKNCPSMLDSFGNISSSTLSSALDDSAFKQYWNITKDQIDTCKGCEFRHICTDCRAFLNEPDNLYSKPLKCGYNPDTCEWEDWSSHPLKEKSKKYYQLE